jgi:hypothetical protein
MAVAAGGKREEWTGCVAVNRRRQLVVQCSAVQCSAVQCSAMQCSVAEQFLSSCMLQSSWPLLQSSLSVYVYVAE